MEPSATAGTGAWDGQAGMAYTLPLNRAVTLDASAIYTFRSEAHNYRLGDRLDLGSSLAWRVWGDAASFPQARHKGRTFWFCSESCRCKFVANPARYSQ